MRFGLNELTELPKPEDLDADLAATVEAREIAAPTAAAPSIRIESGEAVSEAEEDRRTTERSKTKTTRTTTRTDEEDDDEDDDAEAEPGEPTEPEEPSGGD